jgi:ureidoglycolate dehydrogenase (NAD+)
MIYIKKIKIKKILLSILKKAKVKHVISKSVADGLIWASLRGIDSHGINLFPQYIKELKSGRLNKSPKIKIKNINDNFLSIDADHTFGHYACDFAINKSISLASKNGIVFSNVYNSSHCGAMSYFGHSLVQKGNLIISMTQATPRIVLNNTKKVFFGNNPISLICPIDKNRIFSYDSCVTTSSFNKIRTFALNNRKLDPNLALDKNFKMTQNPNNAEFLLPIGDHKGTGLSLLVDILTGGLSGMRMADQVTSMYGGSIKNKRYLSQTFIVLNLKMITNKNVFCKNLLNLIKRIKNNKKIDLKKQDPRYPGEIEEKFYKMRLKKGIPFSQELYKIIMKLYKNEN